MLYTQTNPYRAVKGINCHEDIRLFRILVSDFCYNFSSKDFHNE